MSKIIKFKDVNTVIRTVKKDNKSIVLTGGCFDIIHIGHIYFLRNAKRLADKLVILLESDRKAAKLKGKNRPFFPQLQRAEVLAEFSSVDYVILLPDISTYEDYRSVIKTIMPGTIALTENDTAELVKRKQAEDIGAKIQIIPHHKTLSSSIIARQIGID